MIYTRTGDAGTTSLVGGQRVDKDDARVEAYGTADELNSHLGLLAEMLGPWGEQQRAELKTAQRHLFTLQTLLATEDDALLARLPHLSNATVEELEHQIDAINALLPPLHSFVIAGGSLAGAQAHVCRTVCRRAERRVITLSRQTPIDPTLLRYLNRLSDYLFVLARWAVVAEQKEEDIYIF